MVNKNVKPERVHNAPQTAPLDLQKDPKESNGLSAGNGIVQKIKKIVSELSPNVAKSCAFCNPTILERQKVYTSPVSHILYNFRPYFDNGHFMIVPKEHKDNFQDITWPEFQDIYQEAQCLTRMAKDAGTVHWFVQNGPQAGQTQPHIHFHVLLRNKQQLWEFFVHLALELSGASKTLTAQEYDLVRETVRPFCEGQKAFSAKAAA